MKRIKLFLAIVVLACLSLCNVQASTYTNYAASSGTSGGLPEAFGGGTYMLESVFVAKPYAYQQYLTATPLAVSDVIKMILIPSNTWVQAVGLVLETGSENAGTTIALGDSASATGWLTANLADTVAMAAGTNCYWTSWAGTTIGASGATTNITVTGYTAGKLYLASDYIKATIAGAATTNIQFRVKVLAWPVKSFPGNK